MAALSTDEVVRRVEALLSDAEQWMSTLRDVGDDVPSPSRELADAPQTLVDDLRSRLDEATLTFERLRESDADRRSWSRLESCAIRLARELRFLAAREPSASTSGSVARAS